MKQRLTILTLSVLTVAAFVIGTLATPSPAIADGADQISGDSVYAGPGECTDPEGTGASYALKLTGYLKGCHYVFVETTNCSPSGTYRESGREVFVGEGDMNTFRTTYQFEGKYEDCTNPVVEIFGRCQHPIVAGSGTGIYEGVTGRLDFKDDVATGHFPYRGPPGVLKLLQA